MRCISIHNYSVTLTVLTIGNPVTAPDPLISNALLTSIFVSTLPEPPRSPRLADAFSVMKISSVAMIFNVSG
jgi:hypothetical protein